MKKKKKQHRNNLYKYLKYKFLSNKFEKRKKLLFQILYEFYLFLNNIKSMNDLNIISQAKILEKLSQQYNILYNNVIYQKN